MFSITHDKYKFKRPIDVQTLLQMLRTYIRVTERVREEVIYRDAPHLENLTEWEQWNLEYKSSFVGTNYLVIGS